MDIYHYFNMFRNVHLNNCFILKKQQSKTKTKHIYIYPLSEMISFLGVAPLRLVSKRPLL